MSSSPVDSIDSVINRKWLQVRLGLLPVGSLAGPSVLNNCSRCGSLTGGDIAMGLDGPLDLVGKCSCGKRCRIKCSKWRGWWIGGDN